MNEFAGTIRREYKPLPESKEFPSDIYLPREQHKSRDSFIFTFLTMFVVVSMLCALFIGGYFVYYVKEEKLKSTNTQIVELEPSINTTVENEYDITSKIYNEFYNNITIEVENLHVHVENLSIP